MRYRDSMHFPYPCRQVFDLVADIERYPEFLPGWKYARVVDRSDNFLLAEQQLRAGLAVFDFHTKALLEPCCGIHITANDGPFHELHIDWSFTPISVVDCRVAVDLGLTMKPGLVNGALQLLLETGSSELLPLFERRARMLYSRD